MTFGKIERLQDAFERAAVEIVVEARSRPRPLRLSCDAGNFPAGNLRQRLPTEARAAGAEEDKRVGAVAEPS